ncbi:hypothetical protein COLO4_14126 [Corchorus olitorius]|uniref:Uncharacterized protein n=1 Tax=Corchorus olitorius TaxID=93759 RepID=A0A1R3JTF5_9ROSI|nr:hypothetical protein COLO4_14126 [Corchorus olitorius]
MGVSYLAVSAVSTALSFVGLQLWTGFSLDKLQTDGLISENFIHTENVNHALELLLGSYATVALLANFVLNVFILLILTLKTVFFGDLHTSETRKLLERLINYVIYKALLSAILKRIKGFIKLRMALGALHAALPDATSEEIRAYDDECAICRLAHQINSGLDRQNVPGQTLTAGVFPNQTQNPVEGNPWRSAGLDPGWLHPWPNQSVDGAGPSTGIRSVGLGRVHMMMRHLASVGETYAQTALEDTAWSLWPMNPSQVAGSASSVPPNIGGRYPGNANLHTRTAQRTANDNIANILAMAETVREVLPHVPDELIFQAGVGHSKPESNFIMVAMGRRGSYPTEIPKHFVEMM